MQASQMLEKARDLDPGIRRQVVGLLTGMQTNLQLVKVGNGIHNFRYAEDLLKEVTKRSKQVKEILEKASGRKP